MSAAVERAPEEGRFARMFRACRAARRAALLTYVMGGDPDLRGSLAFARACIDGGADALEIGVPFSDPVADGKVIQRAGERALASGTTVERCLELVRTLRRGADLPIALMSYVNPLLSLGAGRFAARSAEAGADAAIVPDVPPEELGPLSSALGRRGVGLVTFVSPVSSEQRAKAASGLATAFVYFLSVTGVTGARRALPDDLPRQLAQARARAGVPVVVGFGISRPAQARALGAIADGVVVGSAIVARAASEGPVSARAEEISRFVRSLRRALEPGRRASPRSR